METQRKQPPRRYFLSLPLERGRFDHDPGSAATAGRCWRQVMAEPLSGATYSLASDHLYALVEIDTQGLSPLTPPKEGFLEGDNPEGDLPAWLLGRALAWYRALCRYEWGRASPHEEGPQWAPKAKIRTLRNEEEHREMKQFILHRMIGAEHNPIEPADDTPHDPDTGDFWEED